jgi:hypothetical protein
MSDAFTLHVLPITWEITMDFLKRLFGLGGPKEYVDTQGLYFYFKCDNCGATVKVRADKQHDLNNDDGGYVWHKTIVDSRCFRRMQAVIYLDGSYNVTNYELTGGQLLSEEAYLAEEAGDGSR